MGGGGGIIEVAWDIVLARRIDELLQHLKHIRAQQRSHPDIVWQRRAYLFQLQETRSEVQLGGVDPNVLPF